MSPHIPRSVGTATEPAPHTEDVPPHDPESAARHLAADLGEDRLKRDVPLAPHTTFAIGGPADLYYPAGSPDELARAVSAARRQAIPWFLLGTGANILIGDGGFRGLVIHNRARGIDLDPDGGRVVAESGAVVYPDLIEATIDAGLSGLEHYVGIPSSVGGALWQNLHFLSPDRSRTMFIEEVLVEAEILGEDGHRRAEPVGYFELGYDDSILHRRRDVVLTATFQLTREDPARMRETAESNLAWRAERHPPLDTEPSAGSVFQKIEGIGAGRLIDQAGLKGTRIGGAEISPRHANIIINRGGATAADVRALIALAQEEVERRYGYRLVPEISFIGAF